MNTSTRNRKKDGSNFDSTIIKKVWYKANSLSSGIIDKHIEKEKIDAFGHKICKDQYGKETPYGWEIDHIKPKSKDGTDELDNLQPLFWKYNREKGDDQNWKPQSVSIG